MRHARSKHNVRPPLRKEGLALLVKRKDLYKRKRTIKRKESKNQRNKRKGLALRHGHRGPGREGHVPDDRRWRRQAAA